MTRRRVRSIEDNSVLYSITAYYRYTLHFFYVAHDINTYTEHCENMDCRKGSQRFWGRSRCPASLGDDQSGGRAGNGRYRKHEWKRCFAGDESSAPRTLELRGAQACGVPPRNKGSLG